MRNALFIDTKIDDLGWPWTAKSIFGEFRGISQLWGATIASQMKIDPYCQRQRCNSLNVLFRIVFLALICRADFFAMGHHTVYTRTAVARSP